MPAPQQPLSRKWSLEADFADKIPDVPVPAKRPRTQASSSLKPGHHRGSRFWATLSRVHLTRSALREWDRRAPQVLNKRAQTFKTLTVRVVRARDIQQFARQGGPDLTDLRKLRYRAPPIHNMDSPPPSTNRKRSSLPRHETSAGTARVTPISGSISPSTKLTPYSCNFRQRLIDHGVFPGDHWYPDDSCHPDPENLSAIRERLDRPRASLSPTHFTRDDFMEFRRKNDRARSESLTIHDVHPIISGTTDYYEHEMNKRFNNLEPFDHGISAPQPDFYDGMAPELIDARLRQDKSLAKFIVPSTDHSLPAVANFFSEWKGPKGRIDVAMTQACYDGAAGARAIHKLNNYGRDVDDEQYDNAAHSFSATYHPGASLQLYAHHVTAPQSAGGHAEYHMTYLAGYHMKIDTAEFVRGAGAYRQLRLLAKEEREAAVERATRMLERSPQLISPANGRGNRESLAKSSPI